MGAQQQRVGIIGLGNMGGRIARRIVAAGHRPLGYDLDPERASSAGVAAAASVAALGREEVLRGLGWLFETFSARVHHMGPSGAGHTAKLLNNFLNGVSLAASAEVMVAARRAGLDLGTFLDVVNSSSGANYATRSRFPSIIRGDYLEG